MLKILRHKGVAKKVLWFITVIIILSFGFFGSALILRDRNESLAGKIFRKKIDITEFKKAHSEVQLQYKLQYGENFEKVRNMINLEQETWNRLILLHEAKKSKVSDQEVIAYVEKLPFFQRDGKFDTQLYDIILSRVLSVTPRTFEETIRNNIKINKFVDTHIQAVKVTDQEASDAFQRKNGKVQVSYVLVSPDQFKKETTVSEETIKQYYDKYKLEFLMPPAISVAYVSMPYNTQNPVNNDAIRTKAYELYQDLQRSKDLEKSAVKYQAAVNTSPYFSMENADLSLGWTYELLQQLFTLNKTDAVEPFETAKGIQILQIKDRRDAYIPELKDIKNKVQDAVLLDGAKEIAAKKAEEYLAKIKEQQSLTKLDDFGRIAKSLGLEVSQTSLFNREEYLPKIGLSKNFQEAAFSLNQDNKISPVTKISIGYCILHLDNAQLADQKEFEKTKETLKKELSQEKYSQSYNELITDLRSQAQLQDLVSQRKDMLR
ncbi:MAG: SurA N-terminal domain-containing protein [Candidatus Omnitrophica bacterium]|nr:SurA N-terminal domain-containing protein [Candidatus Omnitrophota bacterium]